MALDFIDITAPDDFHLHLRDDAMLHGVVHASAFQFARAIIMPNLKVPVVTTQQARSYEKRILQALGAKYNFEPMMTLFLSHNIDIDDLTQGAAEGLIKAVKMYPAGATTNSAQGVDQLDSVMPILQAMSAIDIPLLIHGEVNDPSCDIFDRESRFIERVLPRIKDKFPDLRIVLEHITTTQALQFVEQAGDKVAATITPHHLLLNRTDIFAAGIHPHLYCLPIAKREHHRQALLDAVVSGRQDLFLGTDSAPHSQSSKQSACGCAGIFCAPVAMALLADIFDQHKALANLEGFTSIYGAKFYGLDRNTSKLRLIRKAWKVPVTLDLVETAKGKSEKIVIFKGGTTQQWQAQPILI